VGAEAAQPLWLLVLVPLAALLVMVRLPWWRAARHAGPVARGQGLRQEARRLGLRLFWTTLLVLALAGVSLVRDLDRQATVFVLDTSASVATVRDQGEAMIQSAERRLRRDDLAGVVVTAAGAQVEEAPTRQPLFARLTSAGSDAATDLAAGLHLAGALVPGGYSGRAVLVSDGRQTRGDAVAAARELAARGMVVDVLPLGPEAAPDVRLDVVDLPDTGHRGELTTLTARLFSSIATTGSLRVYRDDGLLLERPIDLRSGRQDVALPVPVGEPGWHRYQVEVVANDPATDSTTANNALGAVQRVLGPPRALVVVQQPEAAGFLPEALRAAGAEVEVAAPSGVPADLAGWARYDLTVLADVPSAALPPGSMDLLEAYVRDLGRGLVMTGGPNSFGPGGYADTPVERALPVSMDLRGRGRQPRVALVLVIDKSGSMEGPKIELAKEAAARSIRLLRPDDQAGVLVFDSVPQWVAPLTPASERDRLEQAIGAIYASDGTEIYPAVAAGFAAVSAAQADVKHLILLTDGRSASGGEYVDLFRQMQDAHVTLSTVGVGDDVDAGLLQAMARAGRGRYHFAADPSSIPQIFTQETIMATRTILVDQRFYPAAASAGPLLRGMTVVPPLDGYVAVTPKERSEVALLAPEGDPVLAAWQHGAGRAVVWTPDLAGRWSAAWASSPAATTLWGNVVSWLLPPPDAGALAARVEAKSDDAIAVVAENTRPGDWVQTWPTHAVLLGPNGQRQEVELTPAGPGRYQAALPQPGPGAYVVQATQVRDGGGELRTEAGWVAPYPTEYRETGVDRALLAQVAAAGGGRVLDDPVDAVTPPPARPALAHWPLAPLVLVLAALTWPLEIAARRLPVPARPVWLRHVPVGARRLVPAPAPAVKEEPPPAVLAATEHLLEHKRAVRARRH